MAFRPFFEVKKFWGGVIGRDLNATKEEDARAYISSGMVSIRPEEFNGSYSDLLALIERETNECEAYVKKRGLLRSGQNSRTVCGDMMNSYYSTVLIDRQAESYTNDQAAMSELLQGNYTMYIVAAVAIIIILIVILS